MGRHQLPNFAPGSRVTDREGNRATFVRDAPSYVSFLAHEPMTIVRYVGDGYDSTCPLAGMVRGWGSC
jgi:hypothetical protein